MKYFYQYSHQTATNNALFGCFDFRFAVQIIVECYNVMHTYVLGDSRKNELYIARFIDFFQTQILREVSVSIHQLF